MLIVQPRADADDGILCGTLLLPMVAMAKVDNVAKSEMDPIRLGKQVYQGVGKFNISHTKMHMNSSSSFSIGIDTGDGIIVLIACIRQHIVTAHAS